MSVFVDIHVQQSYPFSNLNRDYYNAPKVMNFGGVPRLRVSSQSLKRTVRINHNSSVRTGQFASYLAKSLLRNNQGWSEPGAHLAGLLAAASFSPEVESSRKAYKQKKRTFIGSSTRDAILDYLYARQPDIETQASDSKNNDSIEQLFRLGKYANNQNEQLIDSSGVKKFVTIRYSDGTGANKEDRAEVSDKFDADIVEIITKGVDPSVALYGRFVAEDKSNKETAKVDSALRVAHAFTTHRAVAEEDFWVLADDMMDEESTVGSSNMGSDLFGTGVFYRYATIDVEQLVENLNGDLTIARQVVQDFLTLFETATPSGKQTQTAALSHPSLTHIQVRTDAPMNGANAFETPVTGTSGFIKESAKVFDEYVGQSNERTTANHVEFLGYVPFGIDKPLNLGEQHTVEELISEATDAAFGVVEGK